MDPLNDKELNKLLKEWRAPKAPASLERKVLGEPRPWWKWALGGSIRIPVPVALALLAAVGGWVWWGSRTPAPVVPPRVTSVTLADFEPVEQVKPRIIRSAYETR